MVNSLWKNLVNWLKVYNFLRKHFVQWVRNWDPQVLSNYLNNEIVLNFHALFILVFKFFQICIFIIFFVSTYLFWHFCLPWLIEFIVIFKNRWYFIKLGSFSSHVNKIVFFEIFFQLDSWMTKKFLVLKKIQSFKFWCSVNIVNANLGT